MGDRFGPLVRARAEVAGLVVTPGLVDAFSAYLAVLARWDRKINLTAFDLDVPTDAAIDRLVIEPLRASSLIRPSDRVLIDIGSGGGSPAIPLRLAQPQLETVLVEVRERKAAFLREVGRELGLANMHVHAERFEDFSAKPEWSGAADVISMRAVRPDLSVWQAARTVVKRDGRFLWFIDIGDTTNFSKWFVPIEELRGVQLLSPHEDGA